MAKLEYLKYLLKHKLFVGIEAIKLRMPIHALTHDLSKFRPSEFNPYSKYFPAFSGKTVSKQIKFDFNTAWLLHQHRNKHHWDYWVKSDGKPVPMPRKFIRQMLADWNAMSRNFGGSTQEFYEKNKKRMILHRDTKLFVEIEFERQHIDG